MILFALVFHIWMVDGMVLKLDNFYLSTTFHRIPQKPFYPAQVEKIYDKQKPRLLYGNPDSELANLIDMFESHPVEARIEYIQVLKKFHGRMFPPLLPRNLHSLFQHTSRTVDTRVLRLLIRFASFALRGDEKHIKTAVDVIQFLRNKYPQVSFEYLTPQYILEWYHVISQRIALEGNRPRYLEADETSPDPILIQLNRKSWEDNILLSRLKRLEQTGYESIY